MTNVWVDHCDIYDCADGGIDVVNGADFVTISWCKFYYTTPNGHEDVVLIGNNDNKASTDTGKLHVTLHHNWWSLLCRERMPSVRYGRAHAFNNYYNIPGNNYCARARLNSEVLVENNFFDGVQNPWEVLITTNIVNTDGLLRATGNVTNNTTFTTSYTFNFPDGYVTLVPGTNVLTAGDPVGLNPPPYPYTLDLASAVPNLVTNQAGAGKGPYAQ